MTDTPKSRSKKSGLPPGTPIHIGDKKVENVTITTYRYNEHRLDEIVTHDLEEHVIPKDPQTLTWINVQGLQQVDTLQGLADFFGWHPLVVEDIVNTAQRPKLEDYGDYLFIVLKRMSTSNAAKHIQVEQVSMIQSSQYLVTFQEGGDEPFCDVRNRLNNERGRIRKLGTDYLAYEIIDSVVDQYFVVLEQLDHYLEGLEDQILDHPGPESLQRLHQIKRDAIIIRSSVWPLREVLNHLQHSDSTLVNKETSIYFRDVYDHTAAVIESIEISRDILTGMFDVYLTSLSNRMNETMKVLTVIATIFIPLTFLTGIFGMNFRFMPILEWEWGFLLLFTLMFFLAGGMLVYFRRKRWI